jgi:ribonuclease I (enterobacter ribonuclease)
MRILCFVAALVLLGALEPAQHGDFEHYTFALTWQPGICRTGEGCLADQPHRPLIGLHGLWASRPAGLIARGVTDPQWWSRGCDFYHRSTQPPPIASSLVRRLDAVMPHFERSLLVHEYDKHVQCFGFDATQFFSTELRMRAAVASSAFGAYLATHVDRRVTHAALTAAFEGAFHTPHGASLQLECGKDTRGREVLTQFWMQLRAGEIGAFPAPRVFMDSPSNEDTCPATFLIPGFSGT